MSAPLRKEQLCIILQGLSPGALQFHDTAGHRCAPWLSRVRLLATPWTAAHQAPPSMGFSRQEYWSWVPLPSLNIKLKHIIKQLSENLKIRP